MKLELGMGWAWRQREGIDYLVIEAFERSGIVQHGFSTRKGGVSQGPYESLNIGLHVGDDSDRVRINRQRLATALAVSSERMVVPAQVHGNQVKVVTGRHAGAGVQDLSSALPGVDALVTQETDLALCTVYADCVPVYILDPVHQAIGLAHAGWKGTTAQIGAQTLQQISASFGTKARDCLIGIGPSVGPCCYEVDRSVWRQFTAAFSLKDRARISQVGTISNRFYLNLWEANRLTLMAGGVLAANIWIAGICTRCHQDWFYSYRAAEGQETGRMAAVLALRIDRLSA